MVRQLMQHFLCDLAHLRGLSYFHLGGIDNARCQCLLCPNFERILREWKFHLNQLRTASTVRMGTFGVERALDALHFCNICKRTIHDGRPVFYVALATYIRANSRRFILVYLHLIPFVCGAIWMYNHTFDYIAKNRLTVVVHSCGRR
jgi:hypothetical protein